MKRPIKVLIVEDSEEDAALLIGTLLRGGYDPTYEIIDTPEAMADALNRQKWDLVISDYSMPLFSGLDALKLLQDQDPDLSFILMTGQVGEDVAVEAMKAGAHDYILKSNPARLIPAVERELRDTRARRKNRQNEQALRESQERYRLIVETANEGIWQVDEESRTTFVNQEMAGMLGYPIDEMMGQTPYAFMDEEWGKAAEANMRRRRQGIRGQFEYKYQRKDGTDLWALVSSSPVFRDDGSYAGTIGMHVDSTERKRSEEELALRAQLLDSANDSIVLHDFEGRFRYVNEAACRFYGYTREEMMQKNVFELNVLESAENQQLRLNELRTKGRVVFEAVNFRKDGSRIPVEVNASVIDLGGKQFVLSVARDTTERKQAEEALRESEEKYRMIFKATGTAAMIVEEDTTMSLVNREFETLSGYSKEEIEGKKSWKEFFTEDYLDDMTRYHNLRRADPDSAPKQYETALITRKGDVKHVVDTVSMIPGTNQSIAFMIDISGIKQAETELRLSEERFSKAFNACPSPMSISTFPDGRYIDINEAFLQVFGYRREEVIGIARSELNIWDKPEDLARATQSLYDQKSFRNLEASIRTKSGELLIGLVSGDIIDISDGTCALSVFDDITERKMAEEALRSAHQQLAQIIEFLPDATFVIDSGRRVIAWNRAIEEMTGVDKGIIIGKDEHAYAVPFYGEPRPIMIDLVLMEDSVTSLKYEYVEKTNTTIYGEAYVPCTYQGRGAWLWGTASPLVDDEGKITGAIESIRDITEYKRTEEELKKHHERLEELVAERTTDLLAVNQELEAFTHSVSHDLRAPLRRIEAFSQILLEDYADRLDKQGSEHLERLKASSQHMSQLIDDLLDLSRVTSAAVNRQQTDLSAMAQAIVADLIKEQPERQAHFDIQEGITVFGDPDLLSIMLQNLLDNAWKFTSKKAETEISFGITIYEGRQAYYVRDNGAGFNMAYAGKLFEPFKRLHSAKEYSGTGIGLASVKRIIRRHGGQIWAEGEADQGATFYFTLKG
jgi:PAS domain S-box-containing protein